MKIESFPPILNSKAEILILGTMPGEMSLKLNQYYGHGGNHFWKIMFALFEQPISKDYSDRVKLASNNNIAIWDVLKACVREGSSDSAINSEVQNDFEKLGKALPSLRKICFNGKKAGQYYEKYVNAWTTVPTVILPSTSSANTWKTFEEKLEIWRSEMLC